MICVNNEHDFVLSNFSRKEVFRCVCKMSNEVKQQGGEFFPGEKKTQPV